MKIAFPVSISTSLVVVYYYGTGVVPNYNFSHRKIIFPQL